MADEHQSWVYVYLKGLLMGSADAVPGISGGTMALITGIYGRLISAITSINFDVILTLLEGVRPSKFEEALDTFHDIDGFFLLVLGSGVLTAIVLVLNVVHFLLANFPVPTFGFFWGVIAISAVILARQVDFSVRGTRIAVLAGFLIAFVISGFASNSLGHGILVVFFAGFFSVSAMILPGISGSLILIILGQYEYLSGLLSGLTDGVIKLATSGDKALLLDSSQPVGVFILGGLAGLLTFAHFIRIALETHKQVTFAFLVGLVFGALRAPILEVEKVLAVDVSWIQVMPGFLFLAVLGGAVVFLIDYKAGVVEL